MTSMIISGSRPGAGGGANKKGSTKKAPSRGKGKSGNFANASRRGINKKGIPTSAGARAGYNKLNSVQKGAYKKYRTGKISLYGPGNHANAMKYAKRSKT